MTDSMHSGYALARYAHALPTFEQRAIQVLEVSAFHTRPPVCMACLAVERQVCDRP